MFQDLLILWELIQLAFSGRAENMILDKSAVLLLWVVLICIFILPFLVTGIANRDNPGKGIRLGPVLVLVQVVVFFAFIEIIQYGPEPISYALGLLIIVLASYCAVAASPARETLSMYLLLQVAMLGALTMTSVIATGYTNPGAALKVFIGYYIKLVSGA